MQKKSAARKMTNRTRSKMRVVAEAICFIGAPLCFFFYASNNIIDTTRFQYCDQRVPRALDGFKIVQVSDLHGKVFGRDSRRLFDKIRKEKPDIIAITGDLVDERKYDLDYARGVVRNLVSIAPTFYVSGNHELELIDEYSQPALNAIADAGAYFLDEGCVELTRANGKLEILPRALKDEGEKESEPTPESILLAGIPDPARARPNFREAIEASLARVPKSPEQVRVLLSHRPEAFESYLKFGLDLVFAGHAHGGQFRFPCLLPNGLFAPHQGFFPQYTSGLYARGGTTEIVSRGLGPSVVPTRLFNRPNLVVCELHSDEER